MKGPVPIGFWLICCGLPTLEHALRTRRTGSRRRPSPGSDEGRVDLVEGELHPVLVELLDPSDVLVQAHVGEVGKSRWGRPCGTDDSCRALEGEQHVVGIEFAGRLEVVGAVELHTRAGGRVEVLPSSSMSQLFRQPGSPVPPRSNWTRRLNRVTEVTCIGAGGVLGGVEAGRAALRAEHQVAGGVGERGSRGSDRLPARPEGRILRMQTSFFSFF